MKLKTLKNQAFVVVVLVAASALAIGGCRKLSKEKQGDPNPTAMSGGSGGSGQMAPTKSTKVAKTAKAACKDGARPGSPKSSESYALTVKAPATTNKGQVVKAEVIVTPKTGFKYNKAFPTELTVKAASGVELSRKSYAKKDAAQLDDKGMKFLVAYKAKADGKQVVSGHLNFSVCNDSICQTPSACVAWETSVK